MSTDLGTAHGNVVINALPALAALAALRRGSASTVGAMNTAGRAAITAGTGLVAVGVGITAVFAIAVRKSAELEKRLSYISGITGITKQEMAKLRDVVIQLGQESAYTALEVADGFTELSKAGATVEQMIGGMGDAMITLGQAADIPLDKAATALVAISSTYGLAADQSTRIANVLSGAANASIISVEDMAVTFKYAGGVAANLGISLEDTAVAIALLGNAGIKGSTAGTSLRRIFLQLTPRTDKAAEAMKSLGIITKDGSNRFYDAQGNAKGLSEITEILRTTTAGLTAEMKQKALATIFGDRAINSAIALSKGGTAAFQAMNDQLFRTTAAEVAAKRLDNLAGAFEILKGTIDSALIRAGAPAQKPLQRVVELIAKLVNVFNGLPGPVQQAIVYFLLAIAAVTLVSGGILLTIGVMLRAGAVLAQLGAVFRVFGPLVRQAIMLVRLFSMALLTNPIVLIIVAIIALGVALYLLWTRSEKFRKAVKKLWAQMKAGFTVIVAWFKDLPANVDKAWESVKRFFGDIGSAISDWVSGAWDSIIGFFKGIGSAIAGAFSTVIDFFTSLPGRIAGALAGLGKGVWDRFIGESENAFEAVGYWIGRMITYFPGLFIKLLKILWSVGNRAWSAVSDWAIRGYQTITTWLSQLPGRVKAWWDQMVLDAQTWATNMLLKAREMASNFVSGVASFFSQLPGRVWGWLTGAYNRVVVWVTNMLAKAREGGGNFLRTIGSFFTQLPGRIGAALSSAYSTVVGWAGAMISKAREIGSNFVDGVVSFITGLPGTVSDIIGRVISAFTDMIGTAFNAAKDFASGLWKGFKEGLGISSPSFIEEAMFSIEGTGRNTIDALGKQVRTLQRLGATLPSVAPSSALTGPSVSASRRFPGQSPTAKSSGGDTFIDLDIHNPKPERSSTSVHREMQKLAYHGVTDLATSSR